MSAAFVGWISGAFANVLAVGPAQPYTTIQAAVADAASGDVITLDPGVYSGAVELNGQDLTFTALGLVEWEGSDETLLTIRGGTVAVLGVTFHPDGGNAVSAFDGAVVALTTVEVSGNRTALRGYDGAAVFAQNADVTITNGLFVENRATTNTPGREGRGGHLAAVDATLRITDTVFTQGNAREGGAIALIGRSEVVVEDSSFTTHDAVEDGGVIWAADGAEVVLRRVTITGANAGSDGGAIWIADGALTIEGAQTLDTTAGANGGVIGVLGARHVQLDDLTALHSEARRGGLLSLEEVDSAAVERLLACDSVARQEGGALRLVSHGLVTVRNAVLIQPVTTNGEGGGIYSTDGELTLDHCDILDATASTGAAAVWSDGTLTLQQSLVAWSDGAVAVRTSGGFTGGWNGWFANNAGDLDGAQRQASDLTTDPLLAGYRRNGVCGDDDLRIQPMSPLRDAGDPARPDPDGSRSDVGAVGGDASSPDLWQDNDSDGWVVAYDCDDNNGRVSPDATEICNGIDDDCDADSDEPDAVGAPTWFPDNDRDGVGDEQEAFVACDPPGPSSVVPGDCDDDDADVAPGAVERCDGVDNNCDGSTDGADSIDMLTWYRDGDEDGYGSSGSAMGACDRPEGYTLTDRDCDDADPEISPAAEERCDNIDNNCDGTVDGADAIDPTAWYVDGDGDGYGSDGPGTRYGCARPDGLVRSGEDCDEADPAIHPFAPESCTATADRNCDGYFGSSDNDGDGFSACADCDDGDSARFPGAADTPYDGVHLDCDRVSDFDADGDGEESAEWGGDDCDDTDASIYPGATEILGDAVDSDCDGDPGAAKPEVPGYSCACTTPGAPTPSMGLLLVAIGALRRRQPKDRS